MTPTQKITFAVSALAQACLLASLVFVSQSAAGMTRCGLLMLLSAPQEGEDDAALLARNEKFVKLTAEAQVDASFYRFDKAIEKYKEAIALFPGRRDLTRTARLELAIVYFNAEKYEDAIPQLRDCIPEHPKDLKLTRMLGISLTQAGETDEAEKVLTALLKEDPKDWQAVSAMGALQARRQEFKAALKSYEHARDLVEEQSEFFYAEIYESIAWCHEVLENWDAAIEQYKIVRRKEPRRWSVFYNLGRCYEAKGDVVEQKKQWKTFYDNTDVHVPHHEDVAKFLGLEPLGEK